MVTNKRRARLYLNEGSNPQTFENFRANRLLVKQSKATRRLRRELYRAFKLLARIKKLATKRKDMAENWHTRQQVKTLKAAKRIPSLRVRERNQYGAIYLPQVVFQRRNSSFVPGTTTLGTPYAEYRGRKQYMTDYRPIARLNPPRNATTIRSHRRNAFNASIQCTPTPYYYETAYWAPSPWALMGLAGFPTQLDISLPVEFDVSLANKALLKCYAEINEATIQMNEYIFEWKQVARLLKDPLKTLLRAHKTLERWTRRDAWIYLPERTARRFGKGTLVSKTPTGGILMSMRTKKELPLTGASDAMISAAANRWLQYRYGIMPLALDVTTVLSWYQGNLEKPWNRSASARHHVWKTSEVRDFTQPTQAFLHNFRVTKRCGEYYSAKVWYNVKYDPPLSYKLGVHPSQFISALWNALPYSFVADWFFNVDDWLTAMRTPPWIQLGPNVVTKKVYEKIVARCTSVVPSYCGTSYKLTVKGEPMATNVIEVMRREIDLPKVTDLVLTDRWQTVKNAATALALIYQPLILQATKTKVRL